MPLFQTASTSRQTIVIGLTSSLVLVFRRTLQTSPCSSGTASITLPMTREFLSAVSLTSKTMSPDMKFRDALDHFGPLGAVAGTLLTNVSKRDPPQWIRHCHILFASGAQLVLSD